MYCFAMQDSSPQIAQLYVSHYDWLYKLLYKKMGNQHDALDIAHETFIKLLQQPTQHYQQPRAMLTTVAKNLTINFWRRKQIEQLYYETLSLVQTEYVPSPEDECIAIETICKLNQAFHQLNDREKQVFSMSQNKSMTYAQIADALNISLATVKRDMKRALICCLTILQSD